MKTHAFVRICALIMFALSGLAVIILTSAETYVRWSMNQNFSFLGGWTLPALMLLFLGLTYVLLTDSRSILTIVEEA